MLDQIETSLINHAKTGQKTLIIVDEAQNLESSAFEELRMLSNFQAGEHAMVQLLLLGQPELKERLDTAPDLEQLRQRVIATHHLTAMEPEEIKPYIEHRMGLVGWSGNPAIADEAFAPLFAYSGGIPRKINNLMTRVLLMGSVERRETIDAALVQAVIADLARDSNSVSLDAPAAISPAKAHSADPVSLDFAARIAMLESHSAEQGAVIRRTLELLVNWAESGQSSGFLRAPAR